MSELPLQPEGSLLTRVTDVLWVETRHGRRRVLYALCACGGFLRVTEPEWRDGSRRPRSCRPCANARCVWRKKQHFGRRPEDIRPYPVRR